MEAWREQLYETELYHHGIKGQKWGIRRFQNEDRTWTREGKLRYYTPIGRREFYNSKGVRLHGNEGARPTETINEPKKSVQTPEERKARKDKVTKSLDSGKAFMQSEMIQQIQNEQFNQWAMQESTRAAVNAGNQAASLALSGGINPFMFGMM